MTAKNYRAPSFMFLFLLLRIPLRISPSVTHPRATVSLRLGHARGLTVPRTVIQDPRAASLPRQVEARKCHRHPTLAQIGSRGFGRGLRGVEDVAPYSSREKRATALVGDTSEGGEL